MRERRRSGDKKVCNCESLSYSLIAYDVKMVSDGDMKKFPQVAIICTCDVNFCRIIKKENFESVKTGFFHEKHN